MDSYFSRSIWWLVCHNLFSSFFLPGWSELPKLSGNIILMAILTTILAITLIIILMVTLMIRLMIRLLFVHYALNKWRVIDRNNPLFLLLFPTNSSIALLLCLQIDYHIYFIFSYLSFSLGNELDNYPAGESDPYDDVLSFPDEIMRKVREFMLIKGGIWKFFIFNV